MSSAKKNIGFKIVGGEFFILKEVVGVVGFIRCCDFLGLCFVEAVIDKKCHKSKLLFSDANNTWKSFNEETVKHPNRPVETQICLKTKKMGPLHQNFIKIGSSP